MKFNRLVYTEARPSGGGGRSMTVDFELEEITVDSSGGGVRWCRIGTHERGAIDAKLHSSRPEDWAETYDAPVRADLDWTLRLSETGTGAQRPPAKWGSIGDGDRRESNFAPVGNRAENSSAPVGNRVETSSAPVGNQAKKRSAPVGNQVEKSSAPACADLDWTLRLFDGAALVKCSRGTNSFPPSAQWNAFCLLTDFCFTVTRRYGAPPEGR